MRDKLLRIKHILENRCINGFRIKNKTELIIYCNPHCQRKVETDDYIWRSVKGFLKERDYEELIINDLNREVYVSKIKKVEKN